ncbi:MAG: Si-specific NAD(P)(+) transhydrogenase [Deltaproteobacteria bacterium]|nr:Si-specific NAD(P)(+) transhydrogenase [Deltaproteobacteria bacterium]
MGNPRHYDLLVIGSGPAGEKGAAQAAYFGKKVCIVEKARQVGGASLNTGTLPSKTLRESALVLTGLRDRGFQSAQLEARRQISVGEFMYRKRFVVDRERDRIERNIERHTVDLVYGTASFVDAHTLEVKRRAGGTERLTADFVLIATGSQPFRPPNVPFDDREVFDSDTILDIDRIPTSMTVVGGGVIGCEYASVFAALGPKVTLVESRDRLLPFLDQELGDILHRAMEGLGVNIVLGDDVETVEVVGREDVRTTLKSGRAVTTDKLLWAQGRRGSTDSLNLAAVGLAANPRGQLPVNKLFQTQLPHIYAAGDVIGIPALASTSMEQARVAICHAFGLEYKKHVSETIPFGLYTIPEVSYVGETEEDARKRGVEVLVGRARFRDNARGQIIGDTDGLTKIVFEAPTGRLLGVHIIGERATELIHVGSLCLMKGGSIHDFIDMVFNFPTLSETYKYAAYDGLGQLAKYKAARAGK